MNTESIIILISVLITAILTLTKSIHKLKLCCFQCEKSESDDTNPTGLLQTILTRFTPRKPRTPKQQEITQPDV